jgi:hypothetical protein
MSETETPTKPEKPPSERAMDGMLELAERTLEHALQDIREARQQDPTVAAAMAMTAMGTCFAAGHYLNSVTHIWRNARRDRT